MMDRIDHFADPDPHAETRELLPWLANGTLAGAELARMRAHLAQCAACREQLGWEYGLRAAVRAEPALSAEKAFARLLPRLGAQEAGAGPAHAYAGAATGAVASTSTSTDAGTGTGGQRGPAAGNPPAAPGVRPVRWPGLAAANDPRWLRALAAVQLAAVVALGLALAASTGHEPAYRTLGAHAAPAGKVVVSFDPATPEAELRRILQASGGRVVDGPTATGAWVLAVEPGAAGLALRRLRAEPGVTLAEPLTVESAPESTPESRP